MAGGGCGGQQRGGRVKGGEKGKIAGEGSATKPKPRGDIMREAEKKETMDGGGGGNNDNTNNGCYGEAML